MESDEGTSSLNADGIFRRCSSGVCWGDASKPPCRTRQDTVWGEDEWELFVARQRSQPYHQMGVNSRGTHIDLGHRFHLLIK